MTEDLYRAIYKVATALEVPVVVIALLALALVIVEAGRFVAELGVRRRSSRGRAALLTTAARDAAAAVGRGDVPGATAALERIVTGPAMRTAAAAIVERAAAGEGNAENRVAKALADFDFTRMRRLERTRLLVRAGPALGLMGTLIPLTPALDGLARGDVQALTDNLRLAFSVTVLGILVGTVAFGLSLARDRLYGQEFSDLEYVAAVLLEPAPTEPAA